MITHERFDSNKTMAVDTKDVGPIVSHGTAPLLISDNHRPDVRFQIRPLGGQNRPIQRARNVEAVNGFSSIGMGLPHMLPNAASCFVMLISLKSFLSATFRRCLSLSPTPLLTTSMRKPPRRKAVHKEFERGKSGHCPRQDRGHCGTPLPSVCDPAVSTSADDQNPGRGDADTRAKRAEAIHRRNLGGTKGHHLG